MLNILLTCHDLICMGQTPSQCYIIGKLLWPLPGCLNIDSGIRRCCSMCSVTFALTASVKCRVSGGLGPRAALGRRLNFRSAMSRQRGASAMATDLTGRQFQSSAMLGVSAASLQAGLPHFWTCCHPSSDDSKAGWRATAALQVRISSAPAHASCLILLAGASLLQPTVVDVLPASTNYMQAS